jgi:hypothetical protein
MIGMPSDTGPEMLDIAIARRIGFCRIAGTILLLIYLASFVFLAAKLPDDGIPEWGYVVFAVTFEAMFMPDPVHWFAIQIWSANPLIWIGILALLARRPILAATCGLLALLLVSYYVVNSDALLIGAYLWYASMVGLFVAALLAGGYKMLNGADPNAKRSSLAVLWLFGHSG